MDTQTRKFCFFGHHKCMSQYVTHILEDIGRATNLRVRVESDCQKMPDDYHLTHPNYYWRWKMMADFMRDLQWDILVHLNADQPLLELLSDVEYRACHVIRDPRDVIVSAYFSHMYSHMADANINPWLVEQRERLLRLGREDGILSELDHCYNYIYNYVEWNYDNGHIFETSFETIVENPGEIVLKALQFMGFDLSTTELSQIIEKHSFENKSGGRPRGKEQQTAHYRKGIVGDWQNYFTPKIKRRFKEQFGEAVIRLGYEKSMDW